MLNFLENYPFEMSNKKIYMAAEKQPTQDGVRKWCCKQRLCPEDILLIDSYFAFGLCNLTLFFGLFFAFLLSKQFQILRRQKSEQLVKTMCS